MYGFREREGESGGGGGVVGWLLGVVRHHEYETSVSRSPCPFEVWTSSYGTNSWAFEDRQAISMVFSLQFDPIGLSTAEGKRKFSLIWLIALSLLWQQRLIGLDRMNRSSSASQWQPKKKKVSD